MIVFGSNWLIMLKCLSRLFCCVFGVSNKKWLCENLFINFWIIVVGILWEVVIRLKFCFIIELLIIEKCNSLIL